MDNCNEQLVTLTGYDLLDIKNALESKIKSVGNPRLKMSWETLLSKVNNVYDNPKFKSDYEITSNKPSSDELNEWNHNPVNYVIKDDGKGGNIIFRRKYKSDAYEEITEEDLKRCGGKIGK